ncbi:MAG: sialate O-acetylesterase, partial [SAR324 cluster bacterium]|nr:sialate O-acetylesterase [SAR324 cluster bacterium]
MLRRLFLFLITYCLLALLTASLMQAAEGNQTISSLNSAQRLLERSPQATIGLVPCAEGGSPLSQWMPGQDLSERALALAHRAMAD